MRKFTVIAPDEMTLADVRSMLPGCTVSEVKVKAVTQKQEADFEPVIVLKNGEVIREIDGVSAQKAIAKIMAEVRKGQNSDGRDKHVYPDWGAKPDAEVERYMGQFCGALNHKPAEYTNGVRA
jgi:hypothetical protein